MGQKYIKLGKNTVLLFMTKCKYYDNNSNYNNDMGFL